MPAMADWRQIQARIRKAKNSADAKTKLSELYQRTRDAMVAWELGVVEEKAEQNEEAVKWYTIAAERFRRADWKKKAEEALTRLGAPLPVPGAKPSPEPHFAASSATKSDSASRPRNQPVRQALRTEKFADERNADDGEEEEVQAEVLRRRKRNHRLEPNRRTPPMLPARKNDGVDAAADVDVGAKALPLLGCHRNLLQVPARPRSQHRRRLNHARTCRRWPIKSRPRGKNLPNRFPQLLRRHAKSDRSGRGERPAPMLPSERTAHGRAGDPALASRMSKLESMLRRLVSSPLHRLDEADAAPAGPGVFLLSDSDQITSYYVEACQTLRVGLGNLARGSGRSTTKPARGGRPAFDSGLKTKLAEHLGIGEAKVSQYLKEHCVVRWIQLDDDAPHLAHFAIGVLRTPLNLD